MKNFAADIRVKERIGTMKNILNRSVLSLFALAFALLASQGARAYTTLPNDRILLMNNDTKLLSAVSNQGFDDTDVNAATYWVHTGPAPLVIAPMKYLLKGTNHVMYAKDGTKLWELSDCRAGSAAIVAAGRNYIPWDTTAKSILSPYSANIGKDQASMAGVGSVIMRNTAGAAVYSPFYDEGIGTIYFDAVNSFANAISTELVLEIATNVTEEASSGGATFAYGLDYSEYDWQVCPFTLFTVTGTKLDLVDEAATNVVLASTAGADGMFYRIRTQLNYRKPIRFRIRRLNAESGAIDAAGLAIVDNIIASYPPMTAELHRYGADYDDTLKGVEVLGMPGDFNSPFIANGDTGVVGRAWASFITNSASKLATTVKNPRMVWRWRYLDQKVTDWAVLPFDQVNMSSLASATSNLVTTSALPLNNGVGDIEYFFAAELDAPYYAVKDYAFNTAVGYGSGWTEKIAAITNRASYTELDALPSNGTDYFVRIREGESDYEWVKLVTSVTTNGVEFGKPEEVRMELVGDHTWRYHYYVPTNAVGETLHFHFEGKEYFRTNETDLAYNVRTNTWYSDLSSGLPYLPFTSVASSDFYLEASTVLDDASTHLLIEFNDERKSFSVGHASYQNFNMWTDAVDGFRGNANYNEENPTNGASATGVSDNKRAFNADMGEWDTSAFTDTYWREGFNYIDYSDENYPYNLHQAGVTTPNGWAAENGTYVRGRRGLEYDEDNVLQKSLAWQMDGLGKGTFTLQKSFVPGVGEVSFTARVSQNPAFENFSTYLDGTRCTNYAVSAKITMSRLYDANKCPDDISSCTPSVSLVGYHRESKGCYELRFTRLDEQHLAAELWKWQQASGQMTATLMTSNLLNTAGNSTVGPGQTVIPAFNNLLVPTDNNDNGRNNNWTAVMFSLYTLGTGHVMLDGWISDKRNTSRIDQDVANLKNVIHVEDADPGALTKGSYGVGSCDCQAAFGDLKYHVFTSGLYGAKESRYGVNMTGTAQTEYFADAWDVMYNRWRQLNWDWSRGSGESATWKDTGLSAVIPSDQTIEVLVADYTGSGNEAWKSIGCVTNVSSFSTNTVTFKVHTSNDSFVRLRTGDADASITIDDVNVTSWAGKDRGSTRDYFSDEWTFGRAVVAPTADIRGGDMEVEAAGTNGYVYIFKTAGRTIEFTPRADMVVDRLLLVGGGGAGGWTLGGGGGGGGVQDIDFGTNTVTLKAGQVVNIVVGRGGDNYYVANNDSGNWKSGGNGGSSSVVNFGAAGKKYEVKGGGGGAGWSQRTAASGYATGGGAAQGNDNASYGSRANGTAGQGSSGGLAWGDRSGGGGGASLDADGQGEDANASKNGAGDGGAGRASDITGVIEYYGGGGGGGGGDGSHVPNSTSGGSGGIGGGGSGLNAAAKDRTNASTGDGRSLDGQNGYGGGGGGGSHSGTKGTNAGGKGGSGVVMFRVRTAAKICTLQPARGVLDGATDGEGGEVTPMGVRSPFLEDGLSLLSISYANAHSNCVLWLQVCTECPDSSMVGGYTRESPESEYSKWQTKCVWVFPGAAKGVTATPSGVRADVVTNIVSMADLAEGTLSFYQSLRAPEKGIMRVVVAPEVVREGIARARTDETYGQITITKAYCYNEPKLDMRSWWGWNLHTEGWNTADKSYAYLVDSPNGLSCMLNFSAKAEDNNARDANGIGLGEDNVAEYAKNNPFVQCPPLTNGIGSVSFRARAFANDQARSSWVTIYGSQEPDSYQITDWDMWVKPNAEGGYKPLAEFEITNTTFQTFTWKTTDDNAPPHAIRIEVNAARFGRYGTGYNTAWEKPQATPIQRVLLDEISVSEPIVPRLVFRDVRPFRSRQLREDAHVAVSNVTSASEQPITGESWGLQATIEPQQMSDELDTDSMRVFASFHVGEVPWGYESWKETARIVELPRMGSNLTFRSHIDRPESIQTPVSTADTVQYMVFAEYRDRGGVVHTNWLKAAEWNPPSWYYGLADLNQKYGANLPERFSGYTIIDTVSPKRAWVNEVNYLNTEDNEALDKRNQYIEFAVPQNADLTGWHLRVTGSETYSNLVLAVFGRNNAKTTLKLGSRAGVDYTNSYTFMTLRGPATTNADVKAACDGIWDAVNNYNAHVDDGVLRPNEPYGIALVRPSGIIEHEVVVEGRNQWVGGFLEAIFSATNMVAELLEKQPGSPWFFAGVEQPQGSLGVYRSHGEDATCWTNKMVHTPGQLNRMANGRLQDIDPDWFLRPNGTNVWIYANVNSPHIAQVIAGETNRSVTVMVIGKGESTNIVYSVDRWYEIGSLTTNAEGQAAVEVAGARGRGGAKDVPAHQYTLRLDEVQQSLTVNVGDQASQVVVDAGLPRDDPYFPAVMDWLHRKFGDAEDAEIHPVEYLPLVGELNPRVWLGIKDAYWLDIPPTEEGWVVKAGMGAPGSGKPGADNPVCTPKGYVYTNWVNGVAQEIQATNTIVTLTMMISNRVTGAAHAPKYLQGLEPGSTSLDYVGEKANNWTSCTFKVTGALQKPGVESKYYPLRWFVFGPDSFDENFQTKIEVLDPFLPQGVGVNYGWPAFRDDYQIWYRWRLDGNGSGTASTELLKADSTY